MSDCRSCRSLFEDALYGRMDEARRGHFEAHLGQCDLCREEFAELREVLHEMEKRVRPEPDQAFWDGFWGRLESRMHRDRVLYQPGSSMGRASLFERIRFRVPRWAFQAAAALLLVVLGIFIGRMWLMPPSSGVRTAGRMPGTEDAYPLELASRTRDYVQRSKLVLMAIVNFDADTEDLYALDLPFKRRLSRELVQEADWLKQGLADAHQRRLQELVADLEAVLLQIANLEASEDLAAVELVQTGMQSRGIFLKMHLAEVNRPWEGLASQSRAPSNTDKTRNF